MGGYNSIPQLQMPQMESPLDSAAKATSVVSMLQQQKMQGLQLKDQEAMTAAMHDWDGKDLENLVPLVVKHGASANAVVGLKQKILENKKTLSQMAKDDAETGKNNLETLLKKNDAVLGSLNTLDQVPDAQLGQALIAESGRTRTSRDDGPAARADGAAARAARPGDDAAAAQPDEEVAAIELAAVRAGEGPGHD
jgi:hypothetical protein